jgi:hypothetical protein
METLVTNYSLVFPQGFDDYAAEVEAKGWFGEASLTFAGRQHPMTFYDPGRLRQEVEDEIQRGRVFFEPNLVVVASVTRQNMERAVAMLIASGEVASLSAER